MNVSLNWVKQFVDFELPPVAELVQRISEQIGAVESVIDLGAKYQGVVVAKVVSCEQHPNADKLHVCMLDDGGVTLDVERDENGYVQVVCGASNVREGLLVAWLPPRTTVPESYDKDPFVLEARELRGIVSNGMIASARELALGDEHDGILEIDEPVESGTLFADVYDLNDYIIDIENKMFTHRPDCFGQLGVAREIAGILGYKFVSPDWYTQPNYEEVTKADVQLPLRVVNELPDEVPRFMAVAMSGVTVRPSPFKLQTYLLRVGVKPINNIVDITNYIMILTGQPMHAYDYDKVKALSSGEPTLTVRYPQSNETIHLLNGKEITPREKAIMVAADQQLIGIGGVMGGSETEVDASTTNIILECANFDMYSIRRTSMAHGLFTDAVTRFNKGQSPLQNDRIIAQSLKMLQDVSGGKQASEIYDIKNMNLRVTQMDARIDLDDSSVFSWGAVAGVIMIDGPSFINDRLGTQLTSSEVEKTLLNVEMNVHIGEHPDFPQEIKIIPPFWRTDIAIAEDIVEEVGRLHGYDTLPLAMPVRSMQATPRDQNIVAKQQLRDVLSRAGANEVLSYSFVHGNLLDKVGQDKTQAFEISNALSPDLQYYRLSVLPSLLDKVHANIKAGYDEFALFEIGKAHIQTAYDGDLPAEAEKVALVYAAKQEHSGAAYYRALAYVRQIIGEHNLQRVTIAPYEPTDEQAYYAAGRAAVISVDDTVLGYIGEFAPSVRRALKLPAYCAGFELDLAVLRTILSRESAYTPLSRFPSVSQDITLRVPHDTSHAELKQLVMHSLQNTVPAHMHCTIIDKDIFQKQDDNAHKQVSFGITVVSYEKTLRDKEVTKLLDNVAQAARESFGAERV